MDFMDDGPNVAILDLDGDGMMDILQCFPNEPTFLYTWQGAPSFLIGVG